MPRYTPRPRSKSLRFSRVQGGRATIDLTAVTNLDRAALQRLNAAWERLTAAGHDVVVVPPNDRDARCEFLLAAAHGQLAWARRR
jgi:anti-anti-sigma regulatory factor